MINKGRHYFSGSIVSENISKQDQDLNDFLQKSFEKPDLKLKGVESDNSQVSTAYFSTKTKHPSKHGKHVIKEEEDNESRFATASDFQASTAPNFQTFIIHGQLRVLNKAFVIDMVTLFDEFKSKKKSYHAAFEQKEKDRVKRKWKEKMHEL